MDESAFFSKYSLYAILMQIRYGVPASIALAQAALESGYGSSELARRSNNFFGVKGEGTEYTTTEYFPGEGAVTVQAEFRDYATPFGSFLDHAQLLKDRYPQVTELPIVDATKYLEGRGYATDPNYANKLGDIISSNELRSYDKTARILQWVGVAVIVVLLGWGVKKIYDGRKRR